MGWTALLPGLSVPYDATSPDDCIAGRVQCVDRTVREMTRRFEPLASSCDHNAIFSLTYLRVTEEYRRTVESPTFFDDTPFVNHEDVVFADYYFAAYDAWEAGERADVPPAWRIALDAARDRSVSAYGNLLLGINAHVQRDLPFVVYSLGMVKPNGTSRKPDHDRVNQILNRVTDDLIAEIARRFDPTIEDANLPTTLDDFGLFQLIVSWREAAWRHAELLALAPTSAGTRAGGSGDRGGRRIAGERDPGGRGLPAAHRRQRRARRVLRNSLGELVRRFQNRSSELPTADDQADPVTARSYDSAARTLGDHPPDSS